MTAKLIAITLPENKSRKLRLTRDIDLLAPVDSVIGWRVLLRGPAVILLDPKGRGHEFGRSVCELGWDSADPADYDKIATYTSEPMTRVIPGVEKPSAPPAKATA